MNAHARPLIGPMHPYARPTFWIARNPDSGEVTGYSSENDAYQGFLDYGENLDFYQIDPDGHWTGLNDDFEEWGIEDRADARSMRRHEASLMAGRV